MKIKIITYPNKILRQKTPLIEKVDEKLMADIKNLKKALEENKNHAAGLAAPQIGLNRRIFGLLQGGDKKKQIYINPLIESVKGDLVKPWMVFGDGKQEVFLEGCLSFPDLFGVVKRYIDIQGSWDEVAKGKLVRKKGNFKGIEAIAFQHESEHLDGILFIDHIKEGKGEFYRWEKDKKIKLDVDQVLELAKKI